MELGLKHSNAYIKSNFRDMYAYLSVVSFYGVPEPNNS